MFNFQVQSILLFTGELVDYSSQKYCNFTTHVSQNGFAKYFNI